MHSFILIAVSPHHIYTPTPLDTDTSASKSYFTRRSGGGPGISPRPSRPSTPGIMLDSSSSMQAPSTSNRQASIPLVTAGNAAVPTDLPLTGASIDSPCIPSGLTSALLSSPTASSATFQASTAHSAAHAPHSADPDDAYRSTLQATADSTHFTLFLARHHLFRFLGKEPLKWDAMHPRPIMGIGEATEAVKGVVLALLAAVCRDEHELLSVGEEVMGMFDELEYGGKGVTEQDLRDVWEGATGRAWIANGGNEVDVEVE